MIMVSSRWVSVRDICKFYPVFFVFTLFYQPDTGKTDWPSICLEYFSRDCFLVWKCLKIFNVHTFVNKMCWASTIRTLLVTSTVSHRCVYSRSSALHVFIMYLLHLLSDLAMGLVTIYCFLNNIIAAPHCPDRVKIVYNLLFYNLQQILVCFFPNFMEYCLEWKKSWLHRIYFKSNVIHY